MKKSEYHGGAFEGNESRKIMNNVDKLESHIAKDHEELLPFVACIWHIKLLSEGVDKPQLEDSMEETVEAFKDSFRILKNEFGVSETNKIHVINAHLCDYMRRNNTTLLKTTDQGIEATQSKLDTFLRVHGYLRKNVENISSGESLFNGVLAWNSYVLGDNNTTK